MSRLALWFGMALVATNAAAQAPQVDEATLDHRVAALVLRERQLAGAVARRDSLAAFSPDMMVIGKAPVFVKVPGWAGPMLDAPVRATVDSWAVQIGPLFTRAPAETVIVSFRSDTAGWTRRQIASQLELFPGVVRYRADLASAARVRRGLGRGFAEWLGQEIPRLDPSRYRRDAIVALNGDTTGAGRRCLAGDAGSCAQVLARGGPQAAGVRRSLLASVVIPAGPEGWDRLAADTAASPESRLAAVAGIPYGQAVARWVGELRTPPGDDPAPGIEAFLFALVWCTALSILFARSLAWHRA